MKVEFDVIKRYDILKLDKAQKYLDRYASKKKYILWFVANIIWYILIMFYGLTILGLFIEDKLSFSDLYMLYLGFVVVCLMEIIRDKDDIEIYEFAKLHKYKGYIENNKKIDFVVITNLVVQKEKSTVFYKEIPGGKEYEKCIERDKIKTDNETERYQIIISADENGIVIDVAEPYKGIVSDAV